MTELETSGRPERKRMTNHNTPQLSGMDSANHCAAFPGLSALSTTTIRNLDTIHLEVGTFGHKRDDTRAPERKVTRLQYVSFLLP
jgi:hypothetical protein